METPLSAGMAEDHKSIYERPRVWASRLKHVRGADVLVGACLGAAFWFLVSELGLPAIFGAGGLSLLPFAILAGAVTGATRFRLATAWITASLLGLLLVLAFTPIMEAPSARLIRRDPVPSGGADAIVVLSAGMTLDGLLPQQGLDRLLKGVELARAGVARQIILTREQKKRHGRVITNEADQNRLVAFAGTDVVATGRAASTREEALHVKALADKNGWKRIVLVTSPFHSRRACATFEKAGLQVSCVPADSRDVAVIHLEGPDDRVGAFSLWLYELAGTIRYWAAGWI
jgi:uncharacterized SAM-binding protein YcdF (DUF218 family)